MTDRPDVIIRHGRGVVLVGGDRAAELIEAVGCMAVPTFSGWQVAAVDLPRLRATAQAHGWHLVEYRTRLTA
jgi:hypothetical protein